MTSILATFLFWLPPAPAAHVAAWTVGHPEIIPQLLRVGWRESRLQPVGIHWGDARPEASSYDGQVHWGHLDPECQPRGDWRRWGTRGVMGLNAADAWPYLRDVPCYQPEILDLPVVSMLVAARRYIDRCSGGKRGRWCPKGKR